jgi:hypothetical protein
VALPERTYVRDFERLGCPCASCMQRKLLGDKQVYLESISTLTSEVHCFQMRVMLCMARSWPSITLSCLYKFCSALHSACAYTLHILKRVGSGGQAGYEVVCVGCCRASLICTGVASVTCLYLHLRGHGQCLTAEEPGACAEQVLRLLTTPQQRKCHNLPNFNQHMQRVLIQAGQDYNLCLQACLQDECMAEFSLALV